MTLVAGAWTGGAAWAEEAKQPARKTVSIPYPLDKCPITGQKLGSMGDPVIKQYDGREVRFCCGGCPAKFEKDLPDNLKKLDDAMIKVQLPTYPLTTCVVSGDKLGGPMGEPVNLLYKNRLVRLCCNMHLKDFRAGPDKYLAKLDAAASTQKMDQRKAATSPAVEGAAVLQQEGQAPVAGSHDNCAPGQKMSGCGGCS